MEAPDIVLQVPDMDRQEEEEVLGVMPVTVGEAGTGTRNLHLICPGTWVLAAAVAVDQLKAAVEELDY